MQGLTAILTVNVLLYMMAGVVVAMFLGAIPGMTGSVVMAILIPFIIGKDPITAMALLLGAHATCEFSGAISSILINTPASGLTVATCYDGYPMAQKGEASRAISIAAMASMIGGIFGALVLMASLPIMKPMLLSLGASEYFVMAFVGLTFIAVLGGKSMSKSLMAGGVGLMLSMIGQDPISGTARYAFGTIYLWDGIPLIPFVVGVFAFSGMADIFSRGGKTISTVEVKDGGVRQGIKDVWTHIGMTLKCSALGTVIGMIPGLGGTVSNLMAYGYAAKTSKHKEMFGTGWPEGVIAPEAANHSKEGGSLIPTVALGIPGSVGMAIILGVFMMLGLVPGPDMLTKNLHVTFSLVFTLVISNIMATALGLVLARHLAKFTFLPLKYVVPSVLVLSSIGAYLEGGLFGNLLVAFVMGLIGIGFERFGFPKAPLIIGLILGALVERYLHISLDVYGPTFILQRPISLFLVIVIIAALSLPPLVRKFRSTKGGEAI